MRFVAGTEFAAPVLTRRSREALRPDGERRLRERSRSAAGRRRLHVWVLWCWGPTTVAWRGSEPWTPWVPVIVVIDGDDLLAGKSRYALKRVRLEGSDRR